MAKHSKLSNTGILFELLVRAITSETLSGKDSPAVDIIKKHFVKTELGKEYKLYEVLFKKTQLTEGKANMVLNTVLESSKRLNKYILKKQKYNLIKDIKEHYNLDEFFKTKVSNYKSNAAFHNLMEMYSSDFVNVDANQAVENKLTILEHLTGKAKTEEKDALLEEFNSYDKDLRLLSYRTISDKFNDKYKNLNKFQKTILKEYINSVDNTPKFREFYNKTIDEVKSEIIKLNNKTTNEVSKIKINEIINLMGSVEKNGKVKNDDIINLMQYCDLLEELKKINLN